MTDDPNATNPSDPDSPEVQWLIRGARERHEERMEHAAQEPAVVAYSMEVIERNELKFAEALEIVRGVADIIWTDAEPAELHQWITRARAFLTAFS
jgi:hypothetical protein